MDFMLVSCFELSSAILSQTKYSRISKCDPKLIPKQFEAKTITSYNSNQFNHRKYWCSQNATNQSNVQ